MYIHTYIQTHTYKHTYIYTYTYNLIWFYSGLYVYAIPLCYTFMLRRYIIIILFHYALYTFVQNHNPFVISLCYTFIEYIYCIPLYCTSILKPSILYFKPYLSVLLKQTCFFLKHVSKNFSLLKRKIKFFTKNIHDIATFEARETYVHMCVVLHILL